MSKIEQPKPQIETKLPDRVLSDAELDCVSGGTVDTLGGDVSGRGRVITNGGNNTNTARGFGSTTT
jgi:hypothetical protein